MVKQAHIISLANCLLEKFIPLNALNVFDEYFLLVYQKLHHPSEGHHIKATQEKQFWLNDKEGPNIKGDTYK